MHKKPAKRRVFAEVAGLVHEAVHAVTHFFFDAKALQGILTDLLPHLVLLFGAVTLLGFFQLRANQQAS